MCGSQTVMYGTEMQTVPSKDISGRGIAGMEQVEELSSGGEVVGLMGAFQYCWGSFVPDDFDLSLGYIGIRDRNLQMRAELVDI